MALGAFWTVHPINIRQGDQFAPDFLKISPNNKIPAIVDPERPNGEPLALFESGAILIYLAEKTGKFMPQDPHTRYKALQWLMWQMGTTGRCWARPITSGASPMSRCPMPSIAIFTRRGYFTGVLDKRQQERAYLAGDDYCIADIATGFRSARHEWHGIALEDFPAVKRRYDTSGTRPARQKGSGVSG